MDARWARTALRATLGPDCYRPWHAVAFGIAANAVFGMLGRRERDRRYYERLRQAPFAPPAWSFVPAWTVNNASVLWGNLRLLNLPGDAPNKRPLLWLQGASWLLYSSFGYVYFRKRSVILGFVWTVSHWLLTIASVHLSRAADPKIALSFVTVLAWLTLATPVTAYQAARNPDGLFGTPAWR